MWRLTVYPFRRDAKQLGFLTEVRFMITYHQTKLEELERVDALVVSSINELTREHGL
jgi:hypothetical protein